MDLFIVDQGCIELTVFSLIALSLDFFLFLFKFMNFGPHKWYCENTQDAHKRFDKATVIYDQVCAIKIG